MHRVAPASERRRLPEVEVLGVGGEGAHHRTEDAGHAPQLLAARGLVARDELEARDDELGSLPVPPHERRGPRRAGLARDAPQLLAALRLEAREPAALLAEALHEQLAVEDRRRAGRAVAEHHGVHAEL